MLVSFLLIGGFVGFVSFESEIAQGINVSGIVYNGSGGPWTIVNSPYIIVGDVTVPTGETLTIEQGVEVKFDDYYSIYVDGTLIAVGTEMNRITMTSNKAAHAYYDWRDIRINSTGHGEIKYCDINYATSGIYLAGSSNNIITDNRLSSNYAGLELFPSSNNTIINNGASDNIMGMVVRESSNDIITNNNVWDNDDGIILWDSSNITLTNNNFVNNGVYIKGDILQHFNSHTILHDNIVNGKPLYYYKDSGGIIIDGIPVGQLFLANCTNIDVKNLQINNVSAGIVAAYSTEILIAKNDLSTIYWDGIYLHQSSHSIVTDNHVSSVMRHGGILLGWSSNNSITNNNVSSCHTGIGIGWSSNNIIKNNNVSSINEWGIWADELSNNNIITNNNVWNTNSGISITESSSNNTVTNNNIPNNNYGIFIGGSSLGNVIKRNSISSNNYSVCVWDSSNNNIIDSNNISNGKYGLYIISFSNSNVITGNTISYNDNGGYLEGSSNNIFVNNDIFHNDNGIYLWGSYNNNITANNISDNLIGINISKFSSSNMVRGNTISNNDYGVFIGWTTNNKVYHNNIINNIIQAYDESINNNQWDNGYPSGGNYWSDFDEPGEGAYDDYEGPDQDVPGSDDVVDNGTVGGGGRNPYIIDGDIQDNYPLLTPGEYLFLYEGWNLISIPFTQPDTNIDSVLRPISGSCNAVQWYNVTDQDDHWKHNHIQKPPHLNNLNDINHLMGFWTHITEPGGVILEFNGIKPTQNQSIPIHPGWNLVGYPSLTSHNRTNGLNNVLYGPDVDCIQWYDASLKTWHFMGPDDHFSPGRGYWVHSKVEAGWEVPL